MIDTSSGIVLKYGEVFLKRGRRKYFLNVLARNLQRTLHRVAPQLKLTRPYGSFLVLPIEAGQAIDDADSIAVELAKVFGIVWASPCDILNNVSVEAAEAATVAYAQKHRRRRHHTFKIETRRAFKRFPMTSIDCNRHLGSAVYTALGDIEVDIHDPDLTIHVSIQEERILIHGSAHPGVGGLPVNSNGHALLLLSGGIDSPVAGWLTQKRGVAIDAVTFLSPPFTGPQAREKVEQLAQMLAKQQKKMRLWVVKLTAIQEFYRNNAPPALLLLLVRRSMFRIADAIADEHKHGALVTGESLGQVASQTIPNLHCIGVVANRPVLQPLITYDKVETIHLARRIGTYDTSILPYEDCCSLFVPRHPELRGRPERLEKLEEELSPLALESQALEEAELVLIPERSDWTGRTQPSDDSPVPE